MDLLQAVADDRMRVIGRAMHRAQQTLIDEAKRIFRTFTNRFNLTEDEALRALAEPLGRAEYDRLVAKIFTMPSGAARTALEIRVNSGAYAYRISRVQALNEHIAIETARISQVLEDELTGQLRFTAVDGYNKHMYNLQMQTGNAFNVPDIRGMKVSIDTPWAGANYSTRIWGARDALATDLREIVSSGFLSGESNVKIARKIRDRFGVQLQSAELLVRTETSYIANQTHLQAYRDIGIGTYRYKTALDSQTCKYCAPLDGQTFLVDDAQIGRNYPPIHPRCRCTTGAADDREPGGYRRGRDANGRNVLLPGDMTYPEWYDWQLAGAPADVNSYLRTLRQAGTITLQATQRLTRFRVPGVVPKGVTLTNVRTIAGSGTNAVFRNAQYRADEFGGNAAEWSKRGGILDTDNYVYDIHWDEWNGMQYKTKVVSVRRK
jgi:SPP1 gp7 family putative phage head morphogenesis protein